MSEALDQRIDALRKRIVTTANIPIGMGNYKQILRACWEMMLELVDIMHEMNAAADKVSPTVMEALKKAVTDMIAKATAAEGEPENG